MKRKGKKQLALLTVSAAMTALAVVFTRFLGFSPEGTPFRFEIGFLPIAVTAYIAGPIYSGAAFLIADVIGSLFSGYAPNPWIALTQLLSGIIMGLFLKKKHSLLRCTACFGVIAVLIEILLKSPIFVFMYGWTWSFTLATRTLNALINLPVRIFTYYILLKALKKPLEQII